MKGSVFVLLGCFALFVAAPTHSYSVSEDGPLASRRDRQSGSPSTDAATSGDAGESKAVETDGDANPGDAQAEKSKIRKRDTSSLVGDEMEPFVVKLPPVEKSSALSLLRKLGKYGGQCLEQAFNYIDLHEMPVGFVESWYSEALLTRTDLVKWLKIVKDSVSECLTNYVGELNEDLWRDEHTPPPDPSQTFADVSELLSPLTDIAKTLKKCFEDAIRYLEATSHGPVNTVQRSSESLSDLLTELIETLSLIDGGVAPAGGTVQRPPPGHTVPPYLDSVPVITTYKKRNSLNKPRGYRHYTTLPGLIQTQYVFPKHISDSAVPEFSGFRAEAVREPSTLPEYVNPLQTQQLSLLDIVLDKIYSKLQGKVSPAVNMEAAPVEGLRVDANGALGSYPGNESPVFYPECMNKEVH